MGRKRLFNEKTKTKWCNRCCKVLPYDAFGENRRTASGRQDYCKTCHNAYTGSFWAKVAAYEQHLDQKWRMSPGDYLELWRSQDKKCLICDASLTLYHRDTHIHVFGYRKNLLCTSCDKGMGCFRDDPALLTKALQQVNESTEKAAESENKGKENPNEEGPNDTGQKDSHDSDDKVPHDS